jgi:hypothetical protein
VSGYILNCLVIISILKIIILFQIFIMLRNDPSIYIIDVKKEIFDAQPHSETTDHV